MVWNKLLRRLMDEATDGVGGSAGAPAAVEPQPGSVPAVEDLSTGDDGEGWGGLAEDDADEPAEVPAEAAEPAPEPAPAEPAPVEQAAAEPELQPVTPAPQYSQEQIAMAESQLRSQLERSYAFDEDATLRLQTEPEKVLPVLAAQLHMDVMRAVLSQVQAMVPQMVQQVNTSTTRETQAKGLFYTEWPELAKYEAQVLQVGELYRKMNPGASTQEAVKGIGNLAMAALGLAKAPAAASASSPAPYRPAAPGRRGAGMPAQTEWDSLIDDE